MLAPRPPNGRGAKAKNILSPGYAVKYSKSRLCSKIFYQSDCRHGDRPASPPRPPNGTQPPSAPDKILGAAERAGSGSADLGTTRCGATQRAGGGRADLRLSRCEAALLAGSGGADPGLLLCSGEKNTSPEFFTSPGNLTPRPALCFGGISNHAKASHRHFARTSKRLNPKSAKRSFTRAGNLHL